MGGEGGGGRLPLPPWAVAERIYIRREARPAPSLTTYLGLEKKIYFKSILSKPSQL